MSELLNSIAKFIHEGKIKLVSIDVFDTIVFRKVAHPTDVFSMALQAYGNENEWPMGCEEFKELRVNIETQLRRQAVYGEVTLEDIYTELPFSSAVNKKLKLAELEVEKQVGFIYQPMQKFIELLRDDGIEVILISDMYLSRTQIRDCFFHNSTLLQSLPLHVSSEYKLNKSSGLLFEHLANEQKIDKSGWLHLGDNIVSDFNMPKQKKLQAKYLSAELDIKAILGLESRLFSETQNFNSARMLSSTHFKARSEPIAFSIGSLVWGPILLSFSDWVIDKTIAAGSACILCLMREAEVFAPLIETRLKQRNVSNINVKKLYASRKSTFWPSINIESDTWFEDLLYILVQRRGYTVDDFYRDFLLKPDGMLQSHAEVLLRNADGLYYQGQNLLKQLTEVARKNSQTVKQNIAMQKELFIRYYAHNIGDNFENCTVVDLGNGGTIQHQIELILNTKSAANLLLYSSQRIYRYASTTHYRSFLDAKTDVRDLRLLFSRSPECIEPFLVGDCGTTLGYENDEVGSPIVADALLENSNSVQDFMCGVEKYFLTHYELGFGCIEIQQVIPILYRYIQFPTKDESALFTRIFHQDNFGSNVAYPIVTATQLKDVEQYGVANFHLEFCQNFKLKIGKIHWPQAIITLLSEKFLIKQSGFMSMDTDNNVLSLVERLETEKWTHFSVYGAGLFFEKLLPYIEKADLHVEFLIDRKAEVCDQYTVSGYEVISLDTALKKGCKRILISSFAYKDEISRIIYEQSQKSPQGIVEVLSL